MKQTFATYQHSAIGFPKVKLKFSVAYGTEVDDEAIVTVHGIITKDWRWSPEFQNGSFSLGHPRQFSAIQRELERFDKWVAMNYGEDASVQG